MTDQDKQSNRPSPDSRGDQETGSEGEESKTYVYKSAGIYERKGTIPLFLILVALGLVVWSVYYLVYNWGPPS